jgi:hypothetical protein
LDNGRAIKDQYDKENREGKALPFEPLVPNRETIEAMKAVRRGEVVTVGSVEELLVELNDDAPKRFQKKQKLRTADST